MRVRNRHLVLLLAILVVAWLVLRGPRVQPWNVGQAGSIFQSGAHFGGGQ